MVTISLCMIVRDEEEVLGRCLSCIQEVVDEIIIVDTGSIDKTKEIAEQYNAKIYNFEWIDDFSAARNYSFSKATKDYILWLDADDVILQEDKEQLKLLKKTIEKMEKDNMPVDVVSMKYNIVSKNKEQPVITLYRERLLKKEKNFKWYDPIHEYIKINNNIFFTEIAITHKQVKSKRDRNLKILDKHINNMQQIEPRLQFYYAKELYQLKIYDQAVQEYKKLLSLSIDNQTYYLIACIDLYKYYMIKNNKKKALEILLKSFEFDLPRAEICCMLGHYFKVIENYNKAIFWFELALKIEKPTHFGFMMPDCYDLIPNYELAMCYILLKNYVKAYKYNEEVIKQIPNHPIAKKNKILLISILNKISNNYGLNNKGF